MPTANWRADFPALQQKIYDKPFVYLDSAATTLKPQSVVDRITRYYALESVNVHRGLYRLSEDITSEFEGVREKVRAFINAPSIQNIIFNSGTTEGINLVAQSLGRSILQKGDEILISQMEHHANIVSWQLICEQLGCHLRVLPITDAGDIDLLKVDEMMTPRTRILSLTYVSNALGTINPLHELIGMAKAKGILTVVDAAQAVAHLRVDVQKLDCDFLAFSAHKMFGPTGTGVLYGKKERLEQMRPIKGGGDMIRSVSFEKTVYADVPHIFEAGTPHIAGVLGLGAAIDYMNSLDLQAVHEYEQSLLTYADRQLPAISGLRVIGRSAAKVPIISFVMEGIHAHDLGAILDKDAIAIRTGHHCTQPLMARMGVTATARASMSFYNTLGDIDVLVEGLHKAKDLFA